MANFWTMFFKVFSVLLCLGLVFLSGTGFLGIILVRTQIKSILHTYYYNDKISKEKEKLFGVLKDIVLLFLLLIWATMIVMAITSSTFEEGAPWLFRGIFPYILFLAGIFIETHLDKFFELEKEYKYKKERVNALEERLSSYRKDCKTFSQERDEWKTKYEELQASIKDKTSENSRDIEELSENVGKEAEEDSEKEGCEEKGSCVVRQDENLPEEIG